MKKNLLEMWKNKELRKYIVLKEIVVLMGLCEYLGLGGGFFFIGAGRYQESAIFFTLLGVSYYISAKLGWRVNEMLVRLQVTAVNKENI